MNNVHNRVPWISLAIGVMTIIAPYALGSSNLATKWSLVITGIVVVIVAIVELGMDSHNRGVAHWPALIIIAGVWLLISTSLDAGNTAVIWNDVFLGVTAIAFTSLIVLQRMIGG